ncbi:28S ribosomal mitochondrial [Brachionus plicatilis]|uniref:Small ribosomal subunit protein mS40 n=1 Tax=Brachionus plicatilis TaxID=10195 RepID=A0A3M7SQF0_BRAPC|nr:28S ribosomal mitochondrial [Brachionus plicatilis]
MSALFKFSSNLYRFGNQIVRAYAAKKPPALTEAQIQFQKHTAELGFRERTSIRGTLYEFKDVETSIEYMKSEAFHKAYGDKKIWEWYIRNFKGRYPKSYTRKQCIGGGRYITGNPCPICRDPYLVVNYKNLELLKNFVSPDTGSLYPTSRTNVCRKQQENLEIAYAKACDHGLIDHPVPHRHYDYSVYYPEMRESNSEEKPSVLLGVILGANRKSINNIYDQLTEEDIILK